MANPIQTASALPAQTYTESKMYAFLPIDGLESLMVIVMGPSMAETDNRYWTMVVSSDIDSDQLCGEYHPQIRGEVYGSDDLATALRVASIWCTDDFPSRPRLRKMVEAHD